MLILGGFCVRFFIVTRRVSTGGLEYLFAFSAVRLHRGSVFCAIFLHSDVIREASEQLIDITPPRGRRKCFFEYQHFREFIQYNFRCIRLHVVATDLKQPNLKLPHLKTTRAYALKEKVLSFICPVLL